MTKEEQARRFNRRKTDPLRQWKLSEVDVQAQERWDDFTQVKYQMLKKTHTTHAPWKIIRSNDVTIQTTPFFPGRPSRHDPPLHSLIGAGYEQATQQA